MLMMMIIIFIPFGTEFDWACYIHYFKDWFCKFVKFLPIVPLKMSCPDSDSAAKL